MAERTETGSAGEAETADPLQWEQWADGRVWRLKRGKHYQASAKPIEQRALEGAARMGKAVRTYLEPVGKREYLWLQFADYQIDLYDPCPQCGGTEMVRLHQLFARCETCDSVLLLKLPKD